MDVANGTFWPGYVLCKSFTTSEKRSGYKIVKIVDGVQTVKCPRLLFTETTGHEDMINFMSSYQRLDEKGKHYHPHGYLCWYGCNQYGETNGYIQPIKRVPEYVWIYDYENRGYQRLKRERAIVPSTKEVLTREPKTLPLDKTNVRIKLNQESKRETKRRNENARKESRNKRNK